MGQVLQNHITLRTLRLLLAIEQSGNLTRAARHVNIVPSAASRRVGQLEEALGMQLLYRTTSGVELTPAGLAISRYAHKVVSDLDKLETELRELAAGVHGHVRLSVSGLAMLHGFPDQLARFIAQFPNAHLHVQEETSEMIAAQLTGGTADVGIMLASQHYQDLRMIPYRSEELAVMLPLDHPLAGLPSVRFDALLGENWINPPGAAVTELLNYQARLRGVTLRTRMQVHGLAVICRMVESGFGMTLLPTSDAREEVKGRRLAFLPLDEPWKCMTFFIAVNAAASLTPITEALIEFLLSECAAPRSVAE